MLRNHGGVQEWFNWPVSKTERLKGHGGSNPSPTALTFLGERRELRKEITNGGVSERFIDPVLKTVEDESPT